MLKIYAKNTKGKELYRGFYSIVKKFYQDEGEIVNYCFALDKDALEVLRAKIMAISMVQLPITEKKSISSSPDKPISK